MDKKIVLTIGRQFGSGGREIGRKLAGALNISYYDRELVSLAAKESGLCPEVFENADEKASDGLAYAFSVGLSYMGMYTPHADILSNEGLFKLQSDAIRMLAERESCVIVGRCADYILRDNPHCLSFFIHNNMEVRIQRVLEMKEMTIKQAKERITKTDKTRASYYNYFTNKLWGNSASYHLSIDASVLGIDGTVDYIKELVERKFYR
ncbi:MAG: cytidylate kinase-like family protein [Tannerellaceae bacterium]|nr:cytidylate kinase-like family protein [Tannerellaceae bacterium]MCD8176992.1 cytidylate kinase-like family protein [Tannerellaceae bacterium]